MMSKEWVYKYDSDGNRVGLVEVDELDARPLRRAGMSDWFVAIENEVLKREPFLQYHTTITPIERDMQKAELRALRDKRHRPYSTYVRTIKNIRYTDAGYKVTEDVDITVQDVPYILETIQRLMGSTGRIVSGRQIRGMLQDISDIYTACDVQDRPVTLQISKYTRRRLQIALQKGA